MNYTKFRDELLNEVKNLVEDDTLVTMHTNIKNNGITRYAISLKKEGENCIPTIYLETFFDKYSEGNVDIKELAVQLKNEYSSYCEINRPDFDIEGFSIYENVKNNIFFKMINKEKNVELLKKHPYKEFLDLAIVYYYLVNESEEGNHTTLINNSYFDMWKIDDKELYKTAIKNTLLKNQTCFNTIYNMISDIYDIENLLELNEDHKDKEYNECNDAYERAAIINNKSEEKRKSESNESENKTINLCELMELVDFVEENEITKIFEDIFNQIICIEKDTMYILTNKSKLFGAGVILYKPILKMIAQKLDDDVYILPSSIHEVILMPKRLVTDEKELKQIVVDTNENVVAVEEVLSDSVYLYNRDEDEICIVM